MSISSKIKDIIRLHGGFNGIVSTNKTDLIYHVVFMSAAQVNNFESTYGTINRIVREY